MKAFVLCAGAYGWLLGGRVWQGPAFSNDVQLRAGCYGDAHDDAHRQPRAASTGEHDGYFSTSTRAVDRRRIVDRAASTKVKRCKLGNSKLALIDNDVTGAAIAML
jgi:hypothetical protein